MNNLQLGKRNQLKVLREKDHGVYLEGGDIGDILLPKRYVPQGTKVGDILDVFLYLDQEERLIATTEHPLIEVGQFAYLECTWTNEYGAYTYRIVCSSKIEKFQKAISEKQNPNPTADHTPHCNSQLSTVNCQLSTPDRRVLIGDFSARLFEHLKLTEKGFTPYHDKSPAEEIYAMFGVSKKVFKQAVGDLLKRELIQIKPDGIELTIKGKATGVEE